MDFKTLSQSLSTIVRTVEGSAVAVVKSLKSHTFPVKVVNPVTKVEVKGTVTVGNQKNLESKVSQVEKAIREVDKSIKVESKLERTVKVSNFPSPVSLDGVEKLSKEGNSLVSSLIKSVQALHFPTKFEVTNQIDPTGEIKRNTGAINDVEKAIKSLKLAPTIHVDAPKPIVVPPSSVTVEKTEIDYVKLAKAIAGQMPPEINYQKLSEAISKEISSMVVTGGGSGGGKYAFQDTNGERGYGLMNVRHQVSVVQEDRWGVNNVYRSGNTKYSGEEDVDGNWIVRQIIDDGTDIVMTYATKKNNPLRTNYQDAWDNKLDLTYNLYSVAFALV